MTFGLQFINNSDVVTLDSELSRLVVLEASPYSGAETIYVTFNKVITTPEPPLVFFRPDASALFSFYQVKGSAGAWTGFQFDLGRFTSGSGKWFAAAFKSEESAKYGVRLWDSSSKLLFDNGTPCAQFTRTITSWNYLGAEQTSTGQTLLRWDSPAPLNTGDHVLLNNVAMDLAGDTSRQGNLFLHWSYEGNRVVMHSIGIDLQTTLYVPVVFAKPIS